MTEREKRLLKENKEMKLRLSEAEDALNNLRNAYSSASVKAGDESINVVGATQDITKQEKLEEMTLEKVKVDAMFSMLLNLSSQPFGIEMLERRIALVNKGFETLTGYTREELSDIDWNNQLTPPEYLDLERHKIAELVKTGKPVRYEKEYIRKDGIRVPVELMVNILKDSKGKPEYFFSFVTDITQRKKYEYEQKQLIRTLRAMHNSSLLMVRATDEHKFLRDVCKIIVEDCGYMMAWIGYKQLDAKKSIKPVAYAGFENNYLKSIQVSWADNEFGRGPAGTAIRTGKITLGRNIPTNPALKPWRKEAMKRGYSSSISLPLFMNEEIFGALMILTDEPDPFSDDEQQLLLKMAHDLSYGIKAIRLNLALKQSKENLEFKVKQRTSLLKKTLDNLAIEKQRFQAVLNMIPAYVALITPDHEITFINKNFTKYFGEINDQKCYEIFFGRNEICDDCKMLKVISKGEPYEWEAICKNDRIYQISDFIFNDNDETSLILEIGVDITEKRNIEKLMISKILETEERERRRFASDLHDDLGPTLSAIKLQLSLLTNVKDGTERNKLLDICYQLLIECIDKMRTIANNIMPNLVESYGLETALKSFFYKMEGPTKLSFKFQNNIEGCRFEKETELHLYRIVTELVNNTIKHSGATEVLLDIILTDQELMIEYSDNGIGYDVNEYNFGSGGSGIQTIMNRINILHGTIDFEKKGEKTFVKISKPLSKRISLNPITEELQMQNKEK